METFENFSEKCPVCQAQRRARRPSLAVFLLYGAPRGLLYIVFQVNYLKGLGLRFDLRVRLFQSSFLALLIYKFLAEPLKNGVSPTEAGL